MNDREIAEIKADMADLCRKLQLVIDKERRHSLILSLIKYLSTLI